MAKKTPKASPAPLPYVWRLYSPIGAYLASGRCLDKADGEKQAKAALDRMGRKRGTVSVTLAAAPVGATSLASFFRK